MTRRATCYVLGATCRTGDVRRAMCHVPSRATCGVLNPDATIWRCGHGGNPLWGPASAGPERRHASRAGSGTSECIALRPWPAICRAGSVRLKPDPTILVCTFRRISVNPDVTMWRCGHRSNPLWGPASAGPERRHASRAGSGTSECIALRPWPAICRAGSVRLKPDPTILVCTFRRISVNGANLRTCQGATCGVRRGGVAAWRRTTTAAERHRAREHVARPHVSTSRVARRASHVQHVAP
jgi:hypothetical protein